MATATLDRDTDLDLEALFDAGPPACTSHALHPCTRVATHITRTSCPDRETTRLWCYARFERHLQRIPAEVICLYCRRPTLDCWHVRPL